MPKTQLQTLYARMTPSYLAIRMQADTAEIRTEDFLGVTYKVVPVVAMVEGVRFGANQSEPELGLAAEFGKFPEGWNGRPVTAGHPVNSSGIPVSANNVETLSEWAFGMIMNTEVDDKKLKMEAWLNPERADDVTNGQEIVDLIDAGEILEVSVGFFCEVEERKGKFKGQTYGGVWRNIVPDHLAILKDEIGACSVEDGCGTPRTQELRYMSLKTDKSDCGSSCNCKECKENQLAEQELKNESSRMMTISGGVLDRDILKALDKHLVDAYNVPSYDLFVVGFTSEVVVFNMWTGNTYATFQQNFDIDDNLNITLTGDAQEVMLMTKIVAQDPATGDAPKTNADHSGSEENSMAKDTSKPEVTSAKSKTKAEAEAEVKTQNEAAADVENETGAEEEVEAQAKTETKAQEQVKQEPQVTDPKKVAAAPAPAKLQAQTTEDYIASAPPEIRDVLSTSLRIHNERKEDIVTALVANESCKFSEEYLRAQTLEVLENLASLAAVPNYEGRAAPVSPTQQAGVRESAPEPPLALVRNKSANAA